jgi:hypothetical protein
VARRGSRSRASGGRGQGQGNDAEGARSAVGTLARIATDEALKEVLPGFAMVAGRGWSRGRRVQELSGKEEAIAGDVGLEAEVTDADEGAGQDVKKESTDEGGCGKGELPGAVAVLSIAVEETDLAIFESHETLVADGDAMSVTTEVAEHLCGTGEGCLAVDDPIPSCGLPEEALSQHRSDRCRFLLQ